MLILYFIIALVVWVCGLGFARITLGDDPCSLYNDNADLDDRLMGVITMGMIGLMWPLTLTCFIAHLCGCKLGDWLGERK